MVYAELKRCHVEIYIVTKGAKINFKNAFSERLFESGIVYFCGDEFTKNPGALAADPVYCFLFYSFYSAVLLPVFFQQAEFLQEETQINISNTPGECDHLRPR
jgi:hypothetical protein